ncbi:hypothetical protein GcM1_242039 [Golovinomyces cichoracearum]|uniref:SH3 domain-containing protein n=1 Tax=Golovinomyces cichoracearum TaxID=62708 RepID=A0A420IGX0_9PEZI|nr:hypothetical protein GcM1_242039 [Golovinomyces cichoracearum]
MFGRYAYRRLATRNDKGEENKASTATSVSLVMSSTSSTSVLAGYSTVSSSTSVKTEPTKTEPTTTEATKTEAPKTQATSTKTTVEVLSSSTASVSSSTSVLAITTSTTQAEAQQKETPYLPKPQDEPTAQSSTISQQTQATTPPVNTPAPPQPTLSEAYDTSSVIVETPTTASVSSSSSAQPAKLMVTSLEDLPQSIMSPTSSVPISMPLLVATSSSSAAVMTTLIPKPSISEPSVASASSVAQSNAPSDTSMNASGKVSLILGIVILLATGCIMYQLYFRKKRQAARLQQTEDNEKLSFAGAGAGAGINSSSDRSPHTSQIKSPSMTLSSNPDTIKSTPFKDPINPFGSHAEIVVDSVNAQGPKVIDKVDASTPRLARGASKRGVVSHAFVPGDATTAYRGPAIAEYNTYQGPVNSPPNPDPNSTSKTVPSVYRVQLDFNPSMDDELLLRTGQLVRVLHEFDDGWAMCIRLDSSEQGVCPRTCLSSRPLKPRSPSSSTIGRQSSQATISHNKPSGIKDSGCLPTSPQELPGHRVNVVHETQPMLGPNSPHMRPLPQVPVEIQNSLPTPTAGVTNEMTPQNIQGSKSMHITEILPLKNAARFVAPTQNNSHNPSLSHDSIAPSVDYFSFSKHTSVEENSESIISGHGRQQSVKSMCSVLGVTEPYIGQPMTSEKSVPGQAL